jgi:hypothetical protein
MRPRFASGDVLAINPDKVAAQGDMVVVYAGDKIVEYAGCVPCHCRKGEMRDASAHRPRLSLWVADGEGGSLHQPINRA